MNTGQTGPKTEEGKSRSSQNSLKHGLAAGHLIIPDEEKDLFDSIHDGLRAEIQPKGCLENVIFARLLHAVWNQHRVKHLEAKLFEKGDIDDPAIGKALDRLMRYQRLHDRAYVQNLKLLREQQTLRLTTERIGATISIRENEIIPITADTTKIQQALDRAEKAAQRAQNYSSAPPFPSNQGPMSEQEADYYANYTQKIRRMSQDSASSKPRP